METSSAGRAAFAVFGILVLALAVLAIRATPFLSWVSVLIAAPAMVLLGVQVFTSQGDLFAWSAGFEAVLYFYAAFSMLAYMLEDTRVTTDELFAIGAVFTLMAWGSPTCTSSSRRSSRAASRPSRAARRPGWTCCSCRSPPCRAPDSPTSTR